MKFILLLFLSLSSFLFSYSTNPSFYNNCSCASPNVWIDQSTFSGNGGGAALGNEYTYYYCSGLERWKVTFSNPSGTHIYVSSGNQKCMIPPPPVNCTPPKVNNPDNDQECVDCNSSQQYDADLDICVDIPNPCSDNEVLFNDVCTQCPANSSPSSDYSTCVCVPPRVLTLYNNHNICVDPNVDSDNDGVPDDADAFPNNPDESIDSDNDGLGDNSDPDDDNDGYSDEQEASDNTDPTDSSSHGIGNPDMGNCNNGLPLGLNEAYGIDCQNICITGYHRDSSYVCVSDDTVSNDCSHPDTLLGRDFQTYTYSTLQCLNLGGHSFSLSNCTQYSYACYYNIIDNSDDNLSSSIDNNNTLDSNSSDSIDDSAIISKLIDLQNLDILRNSKLDNIDTSLNYQTTTLSSKLDTLSNINSNINTNLGTKLDNIKTAINNIPSSSIDMSQTNSLLQNIVDDIETDHSDSINSIENVESDMSNYAENAISSYVINFNELSNAINGLQVSNISYSGSCILSVHILNKDLNIGKGIVDNIDVFRPVVMFILNIYFLFLLVKWSILAFADATNRATNLFY